VLRWCGRLAVAFLLLVVLFGIAMLFPRVQTAVAHRLASFASERTGTDIRIGGISFTLDGSVKLTGVYVGDLVGDTLFVVPDLRVKGIRYSGDDRLVKLSVLELRRLRFNLVRAEGDPHSNLTNLLDKLASGDTSSTGDDWTIRCRRFLIDGLHFSYHDRNKEQQPFGVDFDHVDIPDAHIAGNGLAVVGDSIHADIDLFRFSDRSGFVVSSLKGTTSVSWHGVDVANMDLRTPKSGLRGQLRMIADGWSAFNEFTSSVALRLDLDSSLLDMSDIAWFAPELEGIELPMTVSGKVRGTIAELKGRGMKINFGRESRFEGNAELSGLPDIDDTFMLIDVDHFHTTLADAADLPIPPFTSGDRLQLPAETAPMEYLDARGRFTGFLRAFTATGKGVTALGDLRTDLTYERDTLTDRITLTGRAASASFQLGPLIGTSYIGPMAANVQLKAKGRSLRTMAVDLDGTFPLFTINGRTVTGITATGHIERNLFKGKLNTADENLMLDFEGLADLRGRWPLVDFKAKLHHADLKALGFTNAPGYNALSMDADVQGRLSPDSLLGDLRMLGISYCVNDVEHDLGDVHVSSSQREGHNVMRLDASFAEAEVVGEFLPTRLPVALAHVLYSVFPSVTDAVIYDHEPQDFTFELVTRDTGPLFALFVPGLTVAPGSRITGNFNTRTFDMGIGAQLPQVSYGAIRIDSLDVIADKALDLLALSVRSTRQTVSDSLWFGGTAVTVKAYQDELELEVGWRTSSSSTHGDLELLGEVRGMRSITLDLLPSDLYFGRGNWQNDRPSRITIDSTTVSVDSLVLRNGIQRIAVHGSVAKDPTAAMSFDMHAVDLLNLEHLLDGPLLRGTVGGDGKLFDVYGSPYLVSYLCGDSLMVKDKPVGDVRFAATWLEGRSALDLAGTLNRGPIKALGFTGRLGVKGGNELDMLLLFDRFDMALVEPYLPEGISEIGGLVTGNVALTGSLSDPQLNGEVMLTDAGLRIDYLNTRYTFSSEVGIAPDMFTMDFATVRDEEGHTGKLNATVIHEHLSNWNYDIWGSMNNMLVLNTTPEDNSLYYGRGYGTGDFEVSGSVGMLEITVDAATGVGTSIHFPVGGSTEVSPIGFVRFNAIDSVSTEPELDLTGVAIDLDIEVTPDAYFELIFDPTVGDIMSGRGRGSMEMGVTPSGEFSMAGQVELTEGSYLFTLRNVVNKRFAVEPGGRIVWYGDPFDAQLDLRATYKVRASLYDIIPPAERSEAYRKRVPVDVVMQLKDKLMNPEIAFQVRVPTVDESVRAQVNSVLSTEQELNRQVFALIVLNKFLEPPAYEGTGTPSGSSSNVATTTTSELLSNQVSNWLSGLSNDFDLGVNYRPGDNITQDELEVIVSTQLFSERLLLTTNVGVQYGAQSTNNSNTVVGDFQLEYLMTDDGRFRLKAFSVTNDRNLNQADQAPTTQGGGIVYRRDFDKLGDLFRRKKPKAQVP
jgi:TamB, inner membrane protein subunit of TAM complex